MQTIAFQNGWSRSVNISQYSFLNAGISTLTFYAGPRPGQYYNTNKTFSIAIGTTTIIFYSNWSLFTVNYTATSSGSFLFTLLSDGCGTDSSINFAYIAILTTQNVRILTVNATVNTPNLNGFNVFNQNLQSHQNIVINPNQSFSFYGDGINYNTNSLNGSIGATSPAGCQGQAGTNATSWFTTNNIWGGTDNFQNGISITGSSLTLARGQQILMNSGSDGVSVTISSCKYDASSLSIVGHGTDLHRKTILWEVTGTTLFDVAVTGTLSVPNGITA